MSEFELNLEFLEELELGEKQEKESVEETLIVPEEEKAIDVEQKIDSDIEKKTLKEAVEVVEGEQKQEEQPSFKEVDVEKLLLERYSDVFEKCLVGKEGTKKIKEIIQVKDVYELEGKLVFTHAGCNKIRQFLGSSVVEQRLLVEPTNENGYAYMFEVVMNFPEVDGYPKEESKNIGFSSKDNTNPRFYAQKPYMALKRGHDRALLRSNRVGLFDVLSEEETDTEVVKKNMYKEVEKEIYKKTREEVKKEYEKRFSDWTKKQEAEKLKGLVLPATDEKYPNKNIVDLVKTEQDGAAYLNVVIEKYQDNKELVKNALYLKHRISENKKAKAKANTNANQTESA